MWLGWHNMLYQVPFAKMVSVQSPSIECFTAESLLQRWSDDEVKCWQHRVLSCKWEYILCTAPPSHHFCTFQSSENIFWSALPDAPPSHQLPKMRHWRERPNMLQHKMEKHEHKFSSQFYVVNNIERLEQSLWLVRWRHKLKTLHTFSLYFYWKIHIKSWH